MKQLTIEKMIAKVEAWIKYWAKAYDFNPCYRIEKGKDEEGQPIFRFYHDADIYSIINEYRSDGNYKRAGEQFEQITEGSGWFNEAENYDIEYFCIDNF